MSESARAASQREVVERAIAAFNASDAEAFAALTTPDFEWSPSMSPVDGVVFMGAEGIRNYFGELRVAWDSFRVLPDACREQADAILVLGRLEGRGRGSGAVVESPLGMAFDFRGALISRIVGYLDHAAALRAVGPGA
jgi:ketosteroid isomerase-like protein